MRSKLMLMFLVVIFFSDCKKKNPVKSELKVTPQNFLSSEKYKKLIIDFVYDKGYPPTDQSLNKLKEFLNGLINKPSGIELYLKEINGSGKEFLSLGDITQIEESSRENSTRNDVLTAFIYMPNAEYSESTKGYKTLGIQYGTNSIVLFGKTIRNNSGGIGQPAVHILETTIALHEAGHILGLVDAGTPMVSPHMDSAHGHHCSNNACLMYFVTETSNIVKNLVGNTIPQLDNNCLTDLRNNGGK